MSNCDCDTHNKQQCAHYPKKNKERFFKPNPEHINHFKSVKTNKKRQFFSINIFLLSIAIIVSFLFFHDAIVFVSIIGVILVLSSCKTHLTSHQYHSLCDSTTVDGEHQCIFCGHHGIYRCSPNNTNITECRCSKCKEHLFNE